MNDELKLYETDITTPNGQTIHLSYEEVGDILEIVFQPAQANCAIELTAHILLSFHKEQQQAVGLTILDFSLLTTPTELGPRSFALTGLDNLPPDLRETVIHIITEPPVTYFLKIISYYTPSAQTIPLTYLEHFSALPVTA